MCMGWMDVGGWRSGRLGMKKGRMKWVDGTETSIGHQYFLLQIYLYPITILVPQNKHILKRSVACVLYVNDECIANISIQAQL